MSGVLLSGRRALQCVFSVLLLSLMHPATSFAKEVGLRIPERPELTDEKQAKAFADLKGIVSQAVSYALSPDYEVTTTPKAATYTVRFDIGGPFGGCVWQLLCTWNKNDADDPTTHKCWKLPLQFSYCSVTDTAAAIEKINCLAQLLTFGGPVPAPGSDPCGAAGRQTTVEKYRRAYIYCLQFNVEDANWSEKQKDAIRLIPQEIDMSLDEEFKKRGYDLVPATCPSDAPANDVDLEIWASIRQEPMADDLYVQFVVIVVNQEVSSEMKNIIGGETGKISKKDFRSLLDRTVIDYISKRLRDSKGDNQ